MTTSISSEAPKNLRWDTDVKEHIMICSIRNRKILEKKKSQNLLTNFLYFFVAWLTRQTHKLIYVID